MVNFVRTGELPHHDHGHVDGLEDETLPVDIDVYGMNDNLHPHDLKHPVLGEQDAQKRRPKTGFGGDPK